MTDTAFHFRKIAIPAFGPSLLFSIGQGAVLPIIALSARNAGASVALSGLIVGLVGIGSLISNIPASLIIARYGERLAMVWAAAFSVLALGLCLFPSQLGLLATGVFMLGMATSVLLLARQTYLIELVSPAARARAMSTLGGMRRIGVFVGPFLGAAAVHRLGLSGAYWVAILFIFASGALAYRIPDLETPTHPDGTVVRSPRVLEVLKAHWKTYSTLGVGIMLVSALRASRQIVIPLWGEHLGVSPAATSLIYGLMASVDMLAFYPSGKAMDQFGRFWVAVPSVLIMGVSMMLIPLTGGTLSFVLVSMMIGLGNGIGSGLVMTLGADASPREGRTQFLGVWRMVSDVGASGAPALLAGIAAIASLGLGIVVMGLGGFAAAAVFWRWLPRQTGH
ncbi:MFS transporter [Castellaniella sp.]|uniref:MFS transporter n=1 Tax=Castellaniella sp. TaxID=1955812 RepID=UPI0039C88C9B